MKRGDERFIAEVLDAQTRQALVSRLRFSRGCSYLACAAFLLAAVVSLAARQSGLCGLFAALSTINLVVAVAADAKIKLALLAERLTPSHGDERRDIPAQPTNP